MLYNKSKMDPDIFSCIPLFVILSNVFHITGHKAFLFHSCSSPCWPESFVNSSGCSGLLPTNQQLHRSNCEPCDIVDPAELVSVLYDHILNSTLLSNYLISDVLMQNCMKTHIYNDQFYVIISKR